MKNLNIIMKKVNRKTENQTYIKPATNLVLGTSKDQQGNNKKQTIEDFFKKLNSSNDLIKESEK